VGLPPRDPRKKAEIGWRHDITRVRDRVSPRKSVFERQLAGARQRETKSGELIEPDSDANPTTPATFMSHWKQVRSDTETAAWKACRDLILAD
jgi:hypothetical protein